MTDYLALTGIFASGKGVLVEVIALLSLVAVVIGAGVAIKKQTHEGAGSGITSMIGTIVLAVMIAGSLALAAGLMALAHSKGLDQQAPGAVVQPWSQ